MANSVKASFYIIAHSDDWQLFMQPIAFNDLVVAGNKVVFIITTAGDAGKEEKYWAAREEGSKSSIRFCLAPRTTLAEVSGMREFNGHQIHYWSANNATCYFLRLPDGNLDGNGFPNRGYQSLHKLRTGQNNTIAAVDNSTTYYNWPGFTSTLQAIIMYESQGASGTCISYLNPDTNANPNDHVDHYATGLATQNVAGISALPQALFVGYSVRNSLKDLQPHEFFWKAGMFAAYEKAVFDGSGYSTLNEGIDIYLNWCSKSADFITLNI